MLVCCVTAPHTGKEAWPAVVSVDDGFLARCEIHFVTPAALSAAIYRSSNCIRFCVGDVVNQFGWHHRRCAVSFPGESDRGAIVPHRRLTGPRTVPEPCHPAMRFRRCAPARPPPARGRQMQVARPDGFRRVPAPPRGRPGRLPSTMGSPRGLTRRTSPTLVRRARFVGTASGFRMTSTTRARAGQEAANALPVRACRPSSGPRFALALTRLRKQNRARRRLCTLYFSCGRDICFLRDLSLVLCLS